MNLKRRLKGVAASLGILVVLYVCFHYLGEFSSTQSGVLSVLVLAFVIYIVITTQRPAQTFSPFCVSIGFEWHALLSDFKLVGRNKEYDLLWEEMNKIPAGEYSVFRSGIVFTVVAPGLVYLNNHRSFVSKVKIFESIVELEYDVFRSGERGEYTFFEHQPPLLVEGERPFFKHPLWGRNSFPAVYFKPGIDGYELGLNVHSEWWQQLCKSGEIGEIAKTKCDTDYRCGTTTLTVATLPYSAFGIYYEGIDYDRMNERQEARDKELEAHGWKRKIEEESDIQDPWVRIDHKYFAVAHRAI